MKHIQGVTLLETVVFLAIVGIVLLGGLSVITTVYKDTSDSFMQTTALALAQGRMEILVGQKAASGFSSFTDICDVGSPPAVCSSNANYTIASSIVTGYGDDNNYKVITVTVSGDASSSVTTLVGSDS
jgi:type II secretory pathway pseudopilin PulG